MARSEPTPAPMSLALSDCVRGAQLRAYQGRWMAFSGDGYRFIASANTLANLEAKMEKAGEDVEGLLLEWTSNDASIFSGSELS